MSTETLSRDELAEKYLEQLPYEPYPVQEEAILSWFTNDKGVLVCAPTGTGKTMIAQAALFEALHTNTVAYYTTPLIALTEQKFREMQEAAVRWGFSPDDVGLVTGNRRVNPDAKLLVVVAEILLNRLLHPEGFDFEKVSGVVMDEFHSFADPERGIVWELTLSMLPDHVRLLLLSATVGNAAEFINWLDRQHGRKVELVESTERKVPLTYEWVPDMLLGEKVVEMANGEGPYRKTPALVFCFNRDECWSVAEQLKGLPIVTDEQKSLLHAEVNKLGWNNGVGPKIKQMLHRGVGVHHAGMLPKYRRVVEDLFERKLLSYVICTETLAAGINLPARAVLLTSLVKGPFGKQKLVEASIAKQIFGRAGRPQYDDKGYVIALAHEDDVKIHRWQLKYDEIPDTTKDPNLIKAKKKLKKKKPTRRENQTYWTQTQFEQLQAAKPGKLYSKGPLPWRLLAYLLQISPEVDRIRKVIRKRLMDGPRIEAGMKTLDKMLIALHKAGYVKLEPEPPAPREKTEDAPELTTEETEPTPYSPIIATPTEQANKLLGFRSIHPLYGAFLVDQLGTANREERIQALESVMSMPRKLLKKLRVPTAEEMPPGEFTAKLDEELLKRGLILEKHAATYVAEDDEDDDWDEEWVRPPMLGDKLRILFEANYPEVNDVLTESVWAAGELLAFGGNFDKFIASKDLVKQEGIIFRHLLRLILLCGEFAEVTPPGTTTEEWQSELRDIADRLTESCRVVDPQSTDMMIEQAHNLADVVEGEADTTVNKETTTPQPEEQATEEPPSGFGAGILEEE